MQGKGALTWVNGDIATGNFIDGKQEGFGKKSANYIVDTEKNGLRKKELITMYIGKRTDCVKK